MQDRQVLGSSKNGKDYLEITTLEKKTPPIEDWRCFLEPRTCPLEPIVPRT